MITTADILATEFACDEEYIKKFLQAAKELDISTDTFLQGLIYSDHAYTEEKQKEIAVVLKDVVRAEFAKIKPSAIKSYKTTAGGPGSGKTVFFEAKLNNPNAINLNPDAMLLLLPGYQRDLQVLGKEEAYAKWRDASNYLNNFRFVKAVTEGLDIVQDSSSSNHRVIKIFNTLANKYNYQVEIYLFLANEQQRLAAVEHRVKRGGHITLEKDIKSMHMAVLERMLDCYFDQGYSAKVFVKEGEYWLGSGETIGIYAETPGSREIGSTDGIKNLMSHMPENIKCLLCAWLSYKACLEFLQDGVLEDRQAKLNQAISYIWCSLNKNDTSASLVIFRGIKMLTDNDETINQLTTATSAIFAELKKTFPKTYERPTLRKM